MCSLVVDVDVVVVVAAPGAVVVVQCAVVVAAAVANVLDSRLRVKLVECGAVVDDAAVVDLPRDRAAAVALARDTSSTVPTGRLVRSRITTRNRLPSSFDLAAFEACAVYWAVAFGPHVGAYLILQVNFL